MGNLITAEFRKVLTTKLWWALLIPAVALAFGWAFVAALLIRDIAQSVLDQPEFEQLGVSFQNVPWSVFALSRSINISTIFPMLFGALGLSSELRRRTITTSFLTAPNRAMMLSAKALTYVVWGAIYGVLISGFSLLGTLVGSHGHYLPDGPGFLLIALAGIIASVLWTVLGLGVGALLGSTVGSVLLLALYAVIAEPIIDVAVNSHIAAAMPNASADGLTGATAGQIVIDNLNSPLLSQLSQDQLDTLHTVIQGAAGSIGGASWWGSGLIFLAWTAALFGGGMLVNQQRDIT